MGLFSDFTRSVGKSVKKLEIPKTNSPLDAFGGLINESTSLLGGGVNSLGGLVDRSSPLTGALGGALAGGITGLQGLGFLGLLEGFQNREAENRRLQEVNRARAEAEDAERRRQRNEQIFQQATELSARQASNPFADIEQLLGLQSGVDPQTIDNDRIKNFLGLLKGRAGEVQQGQLQPALSQTRLSLVQ